MLPSEVVSGSVACASITVLAFAGRFMGGSWLAPGAFFPMVWAVYLIAAMVLAPLFPLCTFGLWAIVPMVLAFQSGALLFDFGSVRGKPSVSPAPRSVPDWLVRRLLWVTAAVSVISFFGILGLAGAGLERFRADLSLLSLLRLGSAFSVVRYGGSEELSPLVRAGVYAILPASFAAGMLVAATGRHLWLSAVPPVMALMGALIVAGRSGLVMAVVMWLGGYVAVKAFLSEGRYRLVRVGWVVAAGTLGGSLVLIYGIIQWLRAGIQRSFELAYFGEHMLGSWFGSISVWSRWVCSDPSGNPAWGRYTFAGPYNFFGLARREQGLYTTALAFPSGGSSNIYTTFRGLIDDFGLFGAWTALLLAGAAATWVYRRCAAGGVAWCVPLAVFYSWSVYSHLYSMFHFNSVILGWGIGLLLIIWPRIEATRGVPSTVSMPREV